LTHCGNNLRILHFLKPCFSGLRTVYSRYTDVRRNSVWLERASRCKTNADHVLLSQLLSGDNLGKKVMLKVNTWMRRSSQTIHSQQGVDADYGRKIALAREQLREMQAHPCEICHLLHYEHLVGFPFCWSFDFYALFLDFVKGI
jgi:hypothetical protein